MRIALTMRVTEAVDYHEPRDSISHDWLDRLQKWDMTPLPVPNRLGDPCGYLDALAPDLLVLTGGDDPGTCPTRDATEQALLDHARAAPAGHPADFERALGQLQSGGSQGFLRLLALALAERWDGYDQQEPDQP